MEIREIEKKEIWEGFLEKVSKKTFLQSWNWGEFNKRMGHKVFPFGIYTNNQLIGVSLTVLIRAKRGSFFLVPHGPLVLEEKYKEEAIKALLEKCRRLAKEKKVAFLRICPIWERTEENISIFKRLKFRKAPLHVHPENNWILNLKNKTSEDLLKGMRKTTRYLIRHFYNSPDIKITQSTELKDLQEFYKMYQETSKRQKFVPFSYEYLKNELESFKPDNQILIILGKHKNQTLAGAMIIYWQKIGFYHQGASLRLYPKIPIAHLVQWAAIQEALKRGCTQYNFWGIAPEDKPNHPWRGITVFKTGFGGERIDYLPTQDYPFSMKYWINWTVETFRRIKRRY